MPCYEAVKKDIEVIPLRHTCYSSRYDKCDACEYIDKLHTMKEKGEIVDFILTGGRYEEAIVLKRNRTNDGLVLCSEMLSARGWYKQIDKGDIKGIYAESHGFSSFYPSGEIIYQTWASVHGSWKIKKHQQLIVVVAEKDEVFTARTGWSIHYIGQGSYHTCDVVLYHSGQRRAFSLSAEKDLPVVSEQLKALGKTKSGVRYFFGWGRDFGMPRNKAVVSWEEVIEEPAVIIEDERIYEIVPLKSEG